MSIEVFTMRTIQRIQKKFFPHNLGTGILSRGRIYVTDFFEEEKLNDEAVYSKTCQRGSRILRNSKWLIRNTTYLDIWPVR